MIDFEQARLLGLGSLGTGAGIGTLSERSLHAVFKFWFDPCEAHHEVRMPDGLVADIFDGERVTEIQTAGFSRFRPKLLRLLEQYPVTVVYPVTRVKYLSWIDPETGESTPLKRSPRRGQFADIGRELIYLLPALDHPRLTFVLQMVDVEEYRLLDGWGNGGKRGAHRAERMPVAEGERLTVRCVADWCGVLPPDLPTPFTAAAVKKAARLSPQKATTLVNTLYKLGAIIRTGKQGNAFLYEKADKLPPEKAAFG